MPRFLLVLFGALASVLPAQAPRVLVNPTGVAASEQFGTQGALDGLNDVNGDGVPDLVVGGPGWPLPHPTIPGATIAQVGRAAVHSGATGALLFAVFGTFNLQALGRSVANVGDVDGDGLHDIAVGAPMFGPTVPGATPPPPQVQIWSTGTGALVRTLTQGSGGFGSNEFGATVAGIGDVGQSISGAYSSAPDGVPDVLVGAPNGTGAVFVYSGADGALLYALTATTVNPTTGPPILVGGDVFGNAVDGVGDVTGDGVPDFIIGARSNTLGGSVSAPPNTWAAGAALLFSGAGGSLVHLFAGSPGDQLGFDVAGVGDVNGDGVPDLALASLRADGGPGADSGAITLISGATRAALWTTYGDAVGQTFAYAVDGAGDVNGDGVPDVVVGTPTIAGPGGTLFGRVTFLSGVDGAVLALLDGAAAGDLRGRSVAGLGDADGDGFAEVLAGSPGTDVPGSSAGSVALIGAGPFLGPCAARPTETLRVNGSTGGFSRRVDSLVGQSLTITLEPEPGAPSPSPFYAFGLIGVPGPGDALDAGLGLGSFCFPPPLLAPADPRLFLLANSFAASDPDALFAAASPAPYAITLPAGLPFPIQFALQALQLVGPDLKRTNAVLIDVR